MRLAMSVLTAMGPLVGGVQSAVTAPLSSVGSLVQVLAQVNVEPSTQGLPGADLFQRILNWLGQIALWGSLGSLLAGAGTMWAGNQTANFNWSSKGKTLAVAGLIGACVAGVAPTAVNLLFDAARS